MLLGERETYPKLARHKAEALANAAYRKLQGLLAVEEDYRKLLKAAEARSLAAFEEYSRTIAMLEVSQVREEVEEPVRVAKVTAIRRGT